MIPTVALDDSVVAVLSWSLIVVLASKVLMDEGRPVVGTGSRATHAIQSGCRLPPIVVHRNVQRAGGSQGNCGTLARGGAGFPRSQ